MMMLSRTTPLVRRTARCFLSTEAATKMKLNFALPHDTIYKGIEVESVVIPGESGEYGVTVNHVPIVSQLKPGVLQIVHSNAEVEKYFVAGGFALTHADSVTDISCPEAVKLDDLDAGEIQKNYTAAKAAYAKAEAGSIAQAEAEIEVETNKAMGVAIGLSLAS